MPSFDDRAYVGELLSFYYSSFRNDVSIASGLNLEKTTVGKNAHVDIFDIDGDPLFRDYKIINANNENIGFVRSSAKGADLPLIDSIVIGPRHYDLDAGIVSSGAAVREEFEGWDVEYLGLVCYGYPRIGMKYKVSREEERHVIFDAYSPTSKVDDRLVSESYTRSEGEEAGLDGSEPIEGAPVYSYGYLLPESGMGHYQEKWDNARDIVAATGDEIEAGFVGERPKLPAMSGVTLPIELIGQETPVYCAVAVGKMILDYLGFTGYSQSELAEVFETSEKGTRNSKLQSGLERLTDGKWSTTYDDSPTPSEVELGFASWAPGKSGIPGHARLIRGWREYAFVGENGVQHKESFFLINDPYPTGEGRYILEAADKPVDDFYRNMVFLANNA